LRAGLLPPLPLLLLLLPCFPVTFAAAAGRGAAAAAAAEEYDEEMYQVDEDTDFVQRMECHICRERHNIYILYK